jgi:hypothetical protein
MKRQLYFTASLLLITFGIFAQKKINTKLINKIGFAFLMEKT